MAGKKNKDIDMKDMELGDDGLPSDEDLDALQRAIDMEMDGMAQREAAAENSDAEENSEAARIEELEAELTVLKDKALRAKNAPSAKSPPPRLTALSALPSICSLCMTISPARSSRWTERPAKIWVPMPRTCWTGLN